MDIWDWTLSAYARPGVPEACLMLQDEHGQNTPLLLWAVWAEASESAVLTQAAETTRAWDALAVSPLRAIRRELKPPHPPVDDAAREALREDVKAAELRAERVLMETLAALGPRNSGAPVLSALDAAARAWSLAGGRSAPRDALAVLAAALG